MNYDKFPDILVNTPGEVGLTSKRTDWVITQPDSCGKIVITLNACDCHEAYLKAKRFGINVDRKWWQWWIPQFKVTCDDGRLAVTEW